MRTAAAAFLLAIAACAGGDGYWHCQTDADCPAPSICRSDLTCWVVPVFPPDAADGGGPTAPTWTSIVETPMETDLTWALSPGTNSVILKRSGDLDSTSTVQGTSFVDSPVTDGGRSYQLQTPGSASGLASRTYTLSAPPTPPYVYWLGPSSVWVSRSSGSTCPSSTTAVYRSDNGSAFQPMDVENCVDSAIDPSHAYRYFYQSIKQQIVTVVSQTGSTDDSPVSPISAVVAVTDGATIQLSWSGTAGAFGVYETDDGTGKGTPAEPLLVSVGPAPSAYVQCGAGLRCTYYVEGQAQGDPFFVDSAPVSAWNAPDAPLSLSAEVGPSEVVLHWITPAGNPDSYLVSIDGASPVSAVGNSYVDHTAPFVEHAYSVQAVTHGAASFSSTQVLATALGPPEPSNQPTPATETYVTPGLRVVSQTFTITTGGTLQFFEVMLDTQTDGGLGWPLSLRAGPGAAIASDTISLSDPFAPVVGPDLLIPSQPPRFGSLYVSAGETLSASFGPQDEAAYIATSGDSYDGGTLSIDGVVMAGTNLAFAVFVSPSDALLAPQLTEQPVAGAIYLSWTASPGSVTYTVSRGADGDPPVVFAQTQQTWLVDDATVPQVAYRYQVTARGPDGSSADSNALQLQRDSSTLAAWFGDAHDQLLLQPGTSIGQSFTATASGTLESIELSLALATAPTGSLTLALKDSSGTVIASASLQVAAVDTPLGSAPPLLSPLFPEGVVFGFAASAISVGLGDQLSLSLVSDQPLLIRDSGGDGYPGGAEQLDSVIVPGRDIAFKVLVQ